MRTILVEKLKDLERENSRLKKTVAEGILDKQILKNAPEADH